jgi:hypothetical protein
MTEEQRDSYRCATINDEQKAVLKIRGRDVVVRLLDQSAGGFSVSSRKRLRVRKGQRLLVRTSGGWFEAEVAYREVIDRETRVGLERVADLPDPRDRNPNLSRGRQWFTVRSGSSSAGTALMAAIGITLVFWFFLANFAWFGESAGPEKHLSMKKFATRVLDRIGAWAERESSVSESPAAAEE